MSNIFHEFEAGVSEFCRWRFREAQMAFHKCLQRDSCFDPAVFMLGLTQLMGGSFHPASESFTSFLSLASKGISSICVSLGRYKLGIAQKCDGQFTDALATLMAGYTASLQVGARSARFLVAPRPFIFEMGLIHLELDNPASALDCFRWAQRDDILGPIASLELAKYSIAKRDNLAYHFRDAGLEFAVSIGEVGNLLRFYAPAAVAYHQAISLERLGRTVEANEARSKARRLDPSYTLSRFDKSLVAKFNQSPPQS